MPIVTMESGWPELGRISLGHPTMTKKGDKIRPTVTDTITVHSDSEETCAVFAELYGGKVEKSVSWTEEKERWFVVTKATRMPVRLPSSDLSRVCQQWNKAYGSSGLIRRCDGVTTDLWRMEPDKSKKEVVGAICRDAPKPCVCNAEDLPDDQRCSPTILLFVLPTDAIADLRGIGVFAVRSAGFFTNSSLKGDLELLSAIVGSLGGGVPLELCVEQQKTWRGDRPKFRLELAATPREAMALAAGQPAALALPVAAAPSPEGEEPVGGFIDKPTEKPLKDASEGKQESESAVAAIPSAPAPSESPDDPVPAPDVVELHGINVRYIGGEPAKDERDRCTASQWVVINRAGQKAELGPEMVQDIFLQRHGFKGSDAKKETAQEFHNFLIEETKRLMQAAKS